jgi:hypothetical protein
MPNHDPGLHFVVQMALRNALKLVRGLRKQISEAEESVMAGKLLDEIALSSYRIVKDAGAAGHTFAAPTGPKASDPIRAAVFAAQRVLAAHLHPGSGQDREATIKALAGILDHRDLLVALAAVAASDPPPTPLDSPQ